MSRLQRTAQSWTLQRSFTAGIADAAPWNRPRKVRGLTIAMTGASSGIGAAASLRLVERGAHVIAIARSGDKLGELAARASESSGSFTPLAADLTDEADAHHVIDTLNDREIDVLINNAGRSIRRPIKESTHRFHDFQRTMDINYFAAVRLTLGVLDPMIERGTGHIINVCTAAVLPRTIPKFAAYGASKAALEIFGRSLAAELGEKSQIRTTTIYYPLVRTKMIEPTPKYNRAAALTEDEAAEWIHHAIAHRPIKIQPNLMKGAPLLDWASPEVMDRLTIRSV